MTNILQINSSLFSDQGVSSTLANDFVQRLRKRDSTIRVVRRDVTADPVPHLDGERLAALLTPADRRTPAQRAAVDYADALIREIQDADVLVLALPMYNFSVPSTVKAWFDHIARVGVTFRYTNSGPEGLLKGKKAYVFTTRGGLHRNSSTDSQTPFVKTFLAFLGISDAEFVYAEGLNMGDDAKSAGMDEAGSQVELLLAA